MPSGKNKMNSFKGYYNIVYTKDRHPVSNRPIYFEIPEETIKNWIDEYNHFCESYTNVGLAKFIMLRYYAFIDEHFETKLTHEDKSNVNFISWITANMEK